MCWGDTDTLDKVRGAGVGQTCNTTFTLAVPQVVRVQVRVWMQKQTQVRARKWMRIRVWARVVEAAAPSSVASRCES
jgi:hypothetical protein